MASTMAKALLLLQLSLLCFTVFGEETEAVSPIYFHHPAMAPSHPPSRPHHPHGHPPSHAPHHPSTKPPAHAPLHAPTKAPVHAPAHPPLPQTPSPVHPPMQSHPPAKPPALPPTYHFPRSFVAVQGVVYCKSCKYAGVDTLLGASPVLGATVKLQCNNTKYPIESKATTDKNGYFFLEAPKKVTNYGAHKCRVSLVSSPNSACNKPSDLHGGVIGAPLRPEKKYVSGQLPFVLFTVGPFAFEPKCPI